MRSEQGDFEGEKLLIIHCAMDQEVSGKKRQI